MSKTIPDWVFNPENKVLGIVMTWIVGGIWTGVVDITTAVDTLWTTGIIRPLGAVGRAIGVIPETLGGVVLDLSSTVSSIALQGQTAGIAAPFATAITVLFGVAIGAALIAVVMLIIRVATGSIR